MQVSTSEIYLCLATVSGISSAGVLYDLHERDPIPEVPGIFL